ncbi:translation initiation factor eIF-2B subunit epsilon isoform X2 [Nematostella vectensis]|nr:translation initiation factor eIF-2B subunit epsilon isoform X2 [Nematostella vectensis]
MGNQVHCHIISDKYAARVSNLYTYDAISKDILHRWAYPIVPDNSSFFMDDCYSYSRHNLYLDKNLSLARDCVLEENLIIGGGTSVGTGTVISNTVIGKNCAIGDNVRIEGAHLWDNVTVEDNCYISCAILCSNVHIKKNVTVTSGSVVSFNVVLGPDIALRPGARVTLKRREEDETDFGMDDLSIGEKPKQAEPIEFNKTEVGAEGSGYLWFEEEESDDESDKVEDVWGAERESSSEDEVSSIASDISSLPDTPPPEDSRLFYNEVLETIRLGVVDGVSGDNMILEINASKYAYNVTFRDVNQSIGKALLESALHDNNMDNQAQSVNLKKTMMHLKPVFENYVKDAEGQRDLIGAIEDFFLDNAWCRDTLQVCLHLLYEMDVLDETVILHWHAHPGPSNDDQAMEEQKRDLRQTAARFVTWLKEAEEESDDEDDDD